jgi:DNA/RNA-binding domain of Phe-tRNA-synthetase-like protein
MTSRFTPTVATDIFELRPDYQALCVVADGLDNHARHPLVERQVGDLLATAPPSWAAGHLDAWRSAYRAFGAKPQRTPCSAEALMLRVARDRMLPEINAVVDLYNAISVRHAVPVGGENIDAYAGVPRLTRATGGEIFDTLKDGQASVESVPAGEVVWADDLGVTCRRWNWRQGRRTRIDPRTTRAWFVLERLDPMPVDAALEAAGGLMELLRLTNPGARLASFQISQNGTTEIRL